MKSLQTKTRNSYATCKVCKVRGIIIVGLFGENHHEIDLIAGENLLLNKGVIPL